MAKYFILYKNGSKEEITKNEFQKLENGEGFLKVSIEDSFLDVFPDDEIILKKLEELSSLV